MTNHEQICAVIVNERKRQDELKKKGKFPNTCADLIQDTERLAYLAEEFGEVAREVSEIVQLETMVAVKGAAFARGILDKEGDELDKVMDAQNAAVAPFMQQITERKSKLAKELVQVSAICVAWLEGLDREDDITNGVQS